MLRCLLRVKSDIREWPRISAKGQKQTLRHKYIA